MTPQLPANPSEAFRRLNPHLYGRPVATDPSPRTKRRRNDHSTPSTELQNPLAQRDEAPALGAAAQGAAESIRRPVVRFVGFRVQPLDPDNFAGSVKDLLDGLRHSGLIPGDEPWNLILETEQVRVAHRKDERTEIFVINRP